LQFLPELAKYYNTRKVLERALRDHALLVDGPSLEKASSFMKQTLDVIPTCSSVEELVAFEGSAAKTYFGVFNHLILQQKDDFHFEERSRRPRWIE